MAKTVENVVVEVLVFLNSVNNKFCLLYVCNKRVYVR